MKNNTQAVMAYCVSPLIATFTTRAGAADYSVYTNWADME